MRTILPVSTALALMASASAFAEPSFDVSKLYIGGSVSHNVVDSPFGGSSVDAPGVSVFAGYEIPNDIAQVETAIEVGYTQTDDFFNGSNSDISGLWVAGVAQKDLPEISPNLFGIARFGLDIGDDDGLLLGAGAGLHLTPVIDARAEYINKDASSVYQASFIVKF
ncbi:outer membrane beta-barrel protein [Thalassolituus sp. LLYu03]|uniref:outer membrane beta-barrel protein n=1 Tax=Thalassolituus sp. LLYu03 TaxID=3421656 RepID=UPI003D2D2E86